MELGIGNRNKGSKLLELVYFTGIVVGGSVVVEICNVHKLCVAPLSLASAES